MFFVMRESKFHCIFSFVIGKKIKKTQSNHYFNVLFISNLICSIKFEGFLFDNFHKNNLNLIFFCCWYFRRLMSEDDVLSEVEPDAVPNEVRNWLSMTFTRSVSNMKKKGEDKPKFKSVAQAIRAGIMVDR